MLVPMSRALKFTFTRPRSNFVGHHSLDQSIGPNTRRDWPFNHVTAGFHCSSCISVEHSNTYRVSFTCERAKGEPLRGKVLESYNSMKDVASKDNKTESKVIPERASESVETPP